MALIKCPECGKKASNKAQNCPSCGYPLHTKQQDTLRRKKKNVNGYF